MERHIRRFKISDSVKVKKGVMDPDIDRTKRQPGRCSKGAKNRRA